MKHETVTLKRSLKLWQIVLMGIGYMTPMVVFDTFGIASDMTNGHVHGSKLQKDDSSVSKCRLSLYIYAKDNQSTFRVLSWLVCTNGLSLFTDG